MNGIQEQIWVKVGADYTGGGVALALVEEGIGLHLTSINFSESCKIRDFSPLKQALTFKADRLHVSMFLLILLH